MKSWLNGFVPPERARAAVTGEIASANMTILQNASGGQTVFHQNDVGFLYNELTRVATGQDAGWLQQQEDFMLGKVHGSYVRGRAKRRSVKLRSSTNRPQEVALAIAIHKFVSSLNSSSTPTKEKAEGHLDWKRVELLHDLDTDLRHKITLFGSQLSLAILKEPFADFVDALDPWTFMACASDLITTLQRCGLLESHMAAIVKSSTASSAGLKHALHPDRLLQVFDIFELDESLAPEDMNQFQLNRAKDYNGKPPAEAWNDYIKGTAGHLVLKRIADFRSNAIPAVLIWKHKELRKADLKVFKDFTADVLKRGTGMFYPKGTFAGINLTDAAALDNLMAAAKGFDDTNFQRWSKLDAGVSRATDLATVNSSTILSIFGFAAATAKLLNDEQFQPQSLADVMSSGVAMVDDMLLRLVGATSGRGGKFALVSAGAEAFSKNVLAKVGFVFAVIDVARSAYGVSTSRTTGETVGNAMVLAGAVLTTSATGIGLLVAAGVVSVAAAPLTIVAVLGFGLSLAGGFIASLYKLTDIEFILQASFFSATEAGRDAVLALPRTSDDVRKDFRTSANGENFKLQLERVRGLAGGMRLKILNPFTSNVNDYEWQSTPFRNDLSKLPEDLDRLVIVFLELDGSPNTTLLPNLLNPDNKGLGKASAIDSLSIDQKTSIMDMPAWAERPAEAIQRRLASLSGETAPPAPPPDIVFSERTIAQ